MNKLQNQIQYTKKVEELAKKVNEEAKKLQDIEDSKIIALTDLQTLIQRKDNLNKVIKNLEDKIKEKQGELGQTIDKKTKFIETAKAELLKERKNLTEIRQLLSSANEQLDAIMPVMVELKDFIAKESNAKIRFIEQEKKIAEYKKEEVRIATTIEKSKAEIETDRKSVEDMKVYVTDLYGKIATYTVMANKTLEFVNKEIKKNGVPIGFEPINLNLDNFDEILNV